MCLYDEEFGYYSRNAASSARPAISIRRATCTLCSGACWPGSSMKCGAHWARRKRLRSKNSAPAAGSSRKTCWTGQKRNFPNFFAPSATCWSKFARSAPADRRNSANRHPSGKAILDSVPPPGTGTTLFANEFFDALPVEIISPQGSLRIDAHDGRFVENLGSAVARRTGIPRSLFRSSGSWRKAGSPAASAERNVRRV